MHKGFASVRPQEVQRRGSAADMHAARPPCSPSLQVPQNSTGTQQVPFFVCCSLGNTEHPARWHQRARQDTACSARRGTQAVQRVRRPQHARLVGQGDTNGITMVSPWYFMLVPAGTRHVIAAEKDKVFGSTTRC
jgi:hypothetical protein